MTVQSWFTALRLAAAGGRSDRLRVVLTVVGSMVATVTLLSAVAVVCIGPTNGPYRLDVLDQPGLHQGVVIALVLLTVPVLMFVGLCSRLGAPERDRRIASIRMAGATPREAIRIVASETSLATLIGGVAGTVVFFALKAAFNVEGGAPLLVPADVAIPIWAVVSVPILLAIGATASSLGALRNVAVSPFGVTRSMPTKPPRLAPALLFVGGSVALAVLGAVIRAGSELSDLVFGAAGLVGFLAMTIGLVAGSASIAVAVGRVLVDRVRSPALLIAARRMIAAPYTASRATTALLLAALIGGMTQGLRVSFLLGTDVEDDFYRTSFDLVDGVLIIAVTIAAASLLVTTAEAVVSRRRTLASLVASGVPRAVLRRAIMAETLLPLLPTLVLALVGGSVAVRGLTGSTVETWNDVEAGPEIVRVPVPWARLAGLGAGFIAICVVLTALSLIFMRRATDISEVRAAA